MFGEADKAQEEYLEVLQLKTLLDFYIKSLDIAKDPQNRLKLQRKILEIYNRFPTLSAEQRAENKNKIDKLSSRLKQLFYQDIKEKLKYVKKYCAFTWEEIAVQIGWQVNNLVRFINSEMTVTPKRLLVIESFLLKHFRRLKEEGLISDDRDPFSQENIDSGVIVPVL